MSSLGDKFRTVCFDRDGNIICEENGFRGGIAYIVSRPMPSVGTMADLRDGIRRARIVQIECAFDGIHGDAVHFRESKRKGIATILWMEMHDGEPVFKSEHEEFDPDTCSP